MHQTAMAIRLIHTTFQVLNTVKLGGLAANNVMKSFFIIVKD